MVRGICYKEVKERITLRVVSTVACVRASVERQRTATVLS